MNDPTPQAWLKSSLSAREYDDYAAAYIARVEQPHLLDALRTSRADTSRFLEALPRTVWHRSYAQDKWTVADVVQHMVDVERVFAYRALRFARGDLAVLPGFDVDAYQAEALARRRTPSALVADWNSARASTIALFEGFDARALTRHGTASGAVISVRAAGFKLVGHDLHHREVLETRYLPLV